MKHLLLAVTISLFGMYPAFGQLASTTALVGNVSDGAGANVSGAQVVARNTDTGQDLTARTNEEGYYEFQFVRNGTYEITVTNSGFETYIKRGIPVAVNQTVRNDFTLTLGQVNQQVVVTADVPPISTEDATLTEVISTKAVTELPLNNRNSLRVALIVPTVLPGRKTPTGNPGGGEGFIGAGTREIQNSLSMDGVSIMNNLITTTTFRPSVDAIQETQIQTGTYPAQYGHYMGVQINVITKSGTNAVHGAVFHFLRNNILDARGYFENRSISQAPLRQNQFGYAVAGPVVIPGLYDGRNRTFFLSNYEGLRNRQAVPTIETVLTPLMRRGDFSEVTTTAIIDPLDPARPSFQGNRIPESRLSPQALRALQYMPLPTGPGINNNYNVNVPNANDGNQLVHRLDHNITQNTRLFGRYAWANTDLLNGNSNPFNGYTQPVRDRNLVIGYTQVFSPTIVNDFRAGRQHTRIDSENFFTGNNPGAGTALGIPGYTTDADNPGLPNLGITNYLPIGGQNMASSNWYQNDTTTQFADSLSITRGAHNIAVGFDIRRVATARTANNNPRGGFTFTGTITGSAPADFLLGLPLQVTTPGPL
ncbi:MAG: carboxypeptidase regulatory-like domain-containing protein, partial [Bryobacteraceae bacterium]|nr:carboxypeptidase regulatory-like domain-containing protein [Bryobacteraceae bacterium]